MNIGNANTIISFIACMGIKIYCRDGLIKFSWEDKFNELSPMMVAAINKNEEEIKEILNQNNIENESIENVLKESGLSNEHVSQLLSNVEILMTDWAMTREEAEYQAVLAIPHYQKLN